MVLDGAMTPALRTDSRFGPNSRLFRPSACPASQWHEEHRVATIEFLGEQRASQEDTIRVGCFSTLCLGGILTPLDAHRDALLTVHIEVSK